MCLSFMLVSPPTISGYTNQRNISDSMRCLPEARSQPQPQVMYSPEYNRHSSLPPGLNAKSLESRFFDRSLVQTRSLPPQRPPIMVKFGRQTSVPETTTVGSHHVPLAVRFKRHLSIPDSYGSESEPVATGGYRDYGSSPGKQPQLQQQQQYSHQQQQQLQQQQPAGYTMRQLSNSQGQMNFVVGRSVSPPVAKGCLRRLSAPVSSPTHRPGTKHAFLPHLLS